MRVFSSYWLFCAALIWLSVFYFLVILSVINHSLRTTAMATRSNIFLTTFHNLDFYGGYFICFFQHNVIIPYGPHLVALHYFAWWFPHFVKRVSNLYWLNFLLQDNYKNSHWKPRYYSGYYTVWSNPLGHPINLIFYTWDAERSNRNG